MCGAIRFVIEGQARTVSAGVAGALLPILMPSGRVEWVGWGAPPEQHVSSPDAPGYVLKLPAGSWIELAELRWVEGTDYAIDARYANGVARAQECLAADIEPAFKRGAALGGRCLPDRSRWFFRR